jgi:hypothetical protein
MYATSQAKLNVPKVDSALSPILALTEVASNKVEKAVDAVQDLRAYTKECRYHVVSLYSPRGVDFLLTVSLENRSVQLRHLLLLFPCLYIHLEVEVR